MLTPTDIFGLGTWQPYHCSSATPPPLSVVALDGGSQMGRHFRHDVVKPDTTFRKQYAITGPHEVTGDSGMICTDGMCYAKYGDSSVAKGDTVGPKPDSWVLWKNYPGFRVIEVTDASFKIMLAVREEPPFWLCKADSAISKGSTGTVSLYTWAETDTTINVTARALVAAISANKWAQFVPAKQASYDGLIYPGEC